MASTGSLIEAAGSFIWPLGACSAIAAYVAVERALALSGARTVPSDVLAAVSRGEVPANPAPASIAGRLVGSWRAGADAAALHGQAEAELVAVQRGLFLLDTVVGLSPLLGLMGTVAGLAGLFPDQGLPDAGTLTRGVGLAMSTTILGLGIAIPSLVASNWLARRVEVVSARVQLLVQALARAPRR